MEKKRQQNGLINTQFWKKGKQENKFALTNYITPLNRYCEYVAKNNQNIVDIPDKLLNEELAHRNKRFMDYVKYELKRGIYAESSIINNYQSRIMSFFSYNNKSITEFIESLKTGTKLKEVHLDKEKIAKLINGIKSLDYKIALKWMALCGFRVSDVLEELVSSKNGSDEPKYRIQYSSERDVYYIENFTTHKEHVKINFVFIPKELERNLLVAYGHICDNDLRKLDLRKTLMNRIENGTRYKRRHIKRYDLDKALKRVAEKVGLIIRLENTDDGIYDKTVRLHGFRGFYCSKIRVKFPRINWLTNHFEGHTNLNLDDAYQRYLRDFDWMFDKWQQFDKETSIDVEIRDNTNDKIIEVQKENFLLKQKITENDKKLDAILRILKEKAIDLDMTNLEFEEWINQSGGV